MKKAKTDAADYRADRHFEESEKTADVDSSWLEEISRVGPKSAARQEDAGSRKRKD